MTAPPSHAELFDRGLIARRLERAWRDRRGVEGADFLLIRAAAELADRLSLVRRRFARALDAGTPGPHAAQALARGGAVDAIARVAPTPASLGAGDFAGVVGDLERLGAAPQGFDLAVSLLALQFANDLPGALIQLRSTPRSPTA